VHNGQSRLIYYTLDILTVLSLHWQPVEYPPYFTKVISRYTEHAHITHSHPAWQPRFFRKSGTAFTADASSKSWIVSLSECQQLTECKKAKCWCQQDKSECVLFSWGYQGVINTFYNMNQNRIWRDISLMCFMKYLAIFSCTFPIFKSYTNPLGKPLWSRGSWNYCYEGEGSSH
jgi:hypothetical protein